PTRRRFGATKWKSKSSKLVVSNLKRDKKSLHPLLSEVNPSSSGSSALKPKVDTSTLHSHMTVNSQKPRTKSNITVRQRLAKRLGI
ncbi:phd/f-box containing protein, putative, partial [Schistosoma mansoni]